jgi:hypothetical protein
MLGVEKKERTAGAGSGVMESGQTGRRIDDVAAGEDIGLAADSLAIAIITTMTVVFSGCHCYRFATVAFG